MIIPILTRWAQNSLQSSTNELLWINLSSFWGPPKINARGFRRGSGTRKEHDSFQAMELGPVTRANDFPWTIFCQAWYSIPCNLDIASLSLWYPGMNPSQIPKLMLLSSWLKTTRTGNYTLVTSCYSTSTYPEFLLQDHNFGLVPHRSIKDQKCVWKSCYPCIIMYNHHTLRSSNMACWKIPHL